jgi:hypothetical protein
MKRSIVFLLFLALLLLSAGGAGFSQDTSLAISEKAIVVDGVVKPDEYSFTQDFGQLTLYLNRSTDTLWIGVVGATTGWVAVGLGSQRMDAATIFMGFVDAAGKVQFKPQLGSGHSHQDLTAKDVTDSIVSFAMKEAGGKTTLELALKAGTWAKKGQAALDLIFAVGAQDSFAPRHSYRGALEVKLAQ